MYTYKFYFHVIGSNKYTIGPRLAQLPSQSFAHYFSDHFQIVILFNPNLLKSGIRIECRNFNSSNIDCFFSHIDEEFATFSLPVSFANNYAEIIVLTSFNCHKIIISIYGSKLGPKKDFIYF